MTTLPENPAFEHWCYATQSLRDRICGKPVPLMTPLLYRVCGGDHSRFMELPPKSE